MTPAPANRSGELAEKIWESTCGGNGGPDEFKALIIPLLDLALQQSREDALEQATMLLSKRLLNHSHRYDGGLTTCSKSEFGGNQCVIDEIRDLKAAK